MTNSSEEVSSGRNDEVNMIKAADNRVIEIVACRRLVGVESPFKYRLLLPSAFGKEFAERSQVADELRQ